MIYNALLRPDEICQDKNNKKRFIAKKIYIVNIDIMKINVEDFVPLRKMKELSIDKVKMMVRA